MFVLTFHPRKNMFGAASTSGMVMQNVAEKMYSRGYLGNTVDFHADRPAKAASPLINAPATPGAYSQLSSQLTQTLHPRVIATPKGNVADSNMPSVANMNLRDALSCLEKAG